MISIDHQICRACGVCGKVCPRHVPVTEGGRTDVSPDRRDLCMDCGHCAAVCPTGAVTVEGFESGGFRDVEELTVTDETLGLGTCFNHLIPPIINREPVLRQLLGIPHEQEVFTAVTLGFPRYRFKRSVPHRLASVQFLD